MELHQNDWFLLMGAAQDIRVQRGGFMGLAAASLGDLPAGLGERAWCQCALTTQRRTPSLAQKASGVPAELLLSSLISEKECQAAGEMCLLLSLKASRQKSHSCFLFCNFILRFIFQHVCICVGVLKSIGAHKGWIPKSWS